ncbi:hypothetical protein C882_2848 [Caenispirillum salinarum AK4]|uniref:Uncharacterized protein n=1 Tax=Caenispirillum salinarum AK4 TaxID=1238182 RepID=K9GJW0_9PROT|nr:hypothetical protein C882_2848 [Caenispirillum salinarum AK4]
MRGTGPDTGGGRRHGALQGKRGGTKPFNGRRRRCVSARRIRGTRPCCGGCPASPS